MKELWEFKDILDLLNKIISIIGSPSELRIYDSEGRVTGLVNGEVKEEIPGSAYTNGTIMLLYPNETYRYELVGIHSGTYRLLTISVENVDATTFNATDIPTSPGANHQYTIDWVTLSLGEEGVNILVDADGDGLIERIFSSDNELTDGEFIEKTSPTYPTYALTIITGEGGTTYPPPGTYACSDNSTVHVTAIPETGYIFDYWELDGINVGSDNPYAIFMNENHTLKAFFSYAPPPLLTITGTVRDKQGNPIPNVLIVAQDATTEIEVASDTSNATGGYAMSVPPSTYNLIVTPPPESGFGSTTVSNVEVTADVVIDIVLVPAEPVTFGGVVVNRDGNPVPNQYLELYSSAIGSKYVYTDEQGLFSMNVPTGIYTLYMYGGQGAPNVPYSYYLYRYDLNFTEDTFMTITLQTRYLTGKVDIEGNPVANVAISARGYSTFGDFYGWFEARATSDSEGKFNLTVFSSSSVSLTATPPPESPLATVNIANINMTKDKTVLIALFYKAGVLPTANFTWTPETPEVGQSITFNASSSEAGSGIIIRHKWNFGDGTYAIGKIVTHSYSSPGIYTVTLNVTNSKGLWGIIQKQIEAVQPAPGPKAPIASFNYTPSNPTVDQGVTFDASTSYDPDGEIVSYSWDFGDGFVGEGKIVTHSYPQEENYKVTLTVIDNDGKSSSTSQTVTVVKPLTAPIETSGLVIKAMSPVDLVVIDPDYLVISKEFNEIPNAVYMEKDLDGDGSLDDYIFIPEPKIGQYIITVIPEPGADPTATYTLEVSTRDATLLLAENVPISDIPTEPYIINPTTFETPPVTLLTIGELQYIDQLNHVYVSSTTPFALTAEDNPGGSGVMSTSYRIYNDTYDTGWLLYAEPFNLTGLADGTYHIDYNSTDNAGNVEPTHTVTVILDNTPPTTTLTIGEPKYGIDPTYVSTTTSLTLEATDAMSGVDYIEYKIDSAAWITYSAPFNVSDFGSHTVHYRSIDLVGNVEGTQTVWIVVNATSLTYSGDTTGQYSDPVTVEATLIDMASQQPISSKTITFTIGTQSITSLTNNSGTATASIVLDQPAGTCAVDATFMGDVDYLGSSDSEQFVIQKENATVEYTGETVVPTTAKTINLRATIFESQDGSLGDLSKMKATFSIYAGQLGSVYMTIQAIPVSQTEMPGIGVAVATINNLPENGYLIIVSIDANDYYSGPTSDPTTLTVYEPTESFVTGGGWIRDPTGSKGNFGFNVKYTKSGKPQGHSIYVYRQGEWDYIVKSSAWTGLAIDGNHAYFEGKCVVQKYNPETGELLWAEGNYQFRVDTWDNTPNGGIDVYQIRIRDKNGVVYHEAGFSPYGYLQGGNVIVHNAGKTGTTVTIATEEERNWF